MFGWFRKKKRKTRIGTLTQVKNRVRVEYVPGEKAWGIYVMNGNHYVRMRLMANEAEAIAHAKELRI